MACSDLSFLVRDTELPKKENSYETNLQKCDEIVQSLQDKSTDLEIEILECREIINQQEEQVLKLQKDQHYSKKMYEEDKQDFVKLQEKLGSMEELVSLLENNYENEKRKSSKLTTYIGRLEEEWKKIEDRRQVLVHKVEILSTDLELHNLKHSEKKQQVSNSNDLLSESLDSGYWVNEDEAKEFSISEEVALEDECVINDLDCQLKHNKYIINKLEDTLIKLESVCSFESINNFEEGKDSCYTCCQNNSDLKEIEEDDNDQQNYNTLIKITSYPKKDNANLYSDLIEKYEKCLEITTTEKFQLNNVSTQTIESNEGSIATRCKELTKVITKSFESDKPSLLSNNITSSSIPIQSGLWEKKPKYSDILKKTISEKEAELVEFTPKMKKAPPTRKKNPVPFNVSSEITPFSSSGINTQHVLGKVKYSDILKGNKK